MFRFYITDTNEGSIRGTNNEELAEEIAESEDYFVVDTKMGEWIVAEGEREKVQEIKGSR